MIDTKIFDMLYSYLEERSDNNVHSHLNADPEYKNALEKECNLYQHYENLNLSEEQCKVIEKWVDAVTTTNSAYSAVIFRMGMQCCFSLMMQLADLK